MHPPSPILLLVPGLGQLSASARLFWSRSRPAPVNISFRHSTVGKWRMSPTLLGGPQPSPVPQFPHLEHRHPGATVPSRMASCISFSPREPSTESEWKSVRGARVGEGSSQPLARASMSAKSPTFSSSSAVIFRSCCRIRSAEQGEDEQRWGGTSRDGGMGTPVTAAPTFQLA